MTNSLDILIKWATRSRPDRFRRTFQLWNNKRVRFVVTMDEDDFSCNNLSFLSWRGKYQNVRCVVGRHTGKIDAINADLKGEQFDLLIAAADDLIPQCEDYDIQIGQIFMDRFPDRDGALCLHDGFRGDALFTMPILGYAFYQRFGYINHPAYKSLFADNELTEVSKRLGKYHYVPRCIIKHQWIGAGQADPLHERNESYYEIDQKTFYERKASGFL